MNYLAHLYLSFGDEGTVVGNFMADAIKGKQYLKFEESIQHGILIHREIDTFTDSHKLVKKGKRRLRRYRHYAGVIMDVYYDHFLSKNWKNYSEEPLEIFTRRNYDLLHSYGNLLPTRIRYMLGYMSERDWLYNYQYLEGIQWALTGMSKRTAHQSGMENALEELQEHYDLYENEFQAFFGEINSHIHNFTAQLTNS